MKILKITLAIVCLVCCCLFYILIASGPRGITTMGYTNAPMVLDSGTPGMLMAPSVWRVFALLWGVPFAVLFLVELIWKRGIRSGQYRR